LQPGSKQIAAGYMLYGPSTVFALTIGRGVDLFVLDPAYGAFMRVEQGVKIPRANKSYSLNEGNRLTFPEGYQRYLDWAQGQTYSSRYAGAMVADVHRILLKGGVRWPCSLNKRVGRRWRLPARASSMCSRATSISGRRSSWEAPTRSIRSFGTSPESLARNALFRAGHGQRRFRGTAFRRRALELVGAEVDRSSSTRTVPRRSRNTRSSMRTS
jgi:hypothetical protein